MPIINSIPGENSVYDYIVSDNTTFTNLISSPDWLGAKTVVIKPGDYVYNSPDGSGILIPYTVNQIIGLGRPTITINNYIEQNKAAFYYDYQSANIQDHIISGIQLSVNKATAGYGITFFKNFNQVSDCYIPFTQNDGYLYGYSYCRNLYNCSAELGSDNDKANAFHYCQNLSSCYSTVVSSGSKGSGAGYYYCDFINNSDCYWISGSDNPGSCFYNCKFISNCTLFLQATGRWGIYDCQYVSNLHPKSIAVGSTLLGGTNKYISSETVN